ncbi:acyltransferase family protein [Paenarthrobacter ilicis]|uniref:Peptidoglycan/LPS O-acetylase OafA/YrhL n=1 Tax=Paenarthrobacter ilicis TaxID=43665 RepID=A0ABX0TGK8_9MICC|nr:acyltransferase [Paenarthrobacter ilicis]MBM7794160.1 peptidoglycan/LPS O-acetylase OafA/YrhL [Paenarthrobacter ilicis]NIJ00340.1 peptidoglycan/LPS O-acetylase OafA/YrhL [Paenarthrobacter ilicis]
MSSTLGSSTTHPALNGSGPATRDLVVDFIRVACMFAVVAVHLLMMGISVDRAGIGVGNPLTSLSWFAQGTWFGQVMPLFFVVGGFASITSWRSLRRKGGDAGDYLRNRVLRLVRPTVALYAFLAAALWIATAAGVPGDLLSVIAVGAGVQLWFLAAYLICQAMVPLMARFHEQAPYRTLAALAAGAVVVDVVRLGLEQNPWGFDSNPIGLLNMVFVWGMLQQLGFLYADGFFDRFARWHLVLAAIACYVAMIPLTHAGPYPVDMLTNQNPPMFPLILVGLAHVLLVKAVYPVLQRFVQVGWVQKVMFVVGSRAMTIYLWHLPLIIAMFGIALVLRLPFPEPASAEWWLTRPLFYVAAWALVLLVSTPLVRLELATTALAPGAPRPAMWRIAAGTVLAVIPPFVVMRSGLDTANATWGLVLLVAAVALVTGRVTGRTWKTPRTLA